jgi:general secretion pathway protein G
LGLVGGFDHFEAARRARTDVDLHSLEIAVKLFHLKEGRLPQESEWPAFLFDGSENHPGAYVDADRNDDKNVRDPWGNPYLYKKTAAKEFEIITYGADGVPGGTGDDADRSTKQK